MYEIDIRLFLDPAKQSSVMLQVKRIPSHMRDLQSPGSRDPQDLPRENPQPLHARRLVASFKQKLQPKTDPKKRYFLFYHFFDHRYKIPSVQIFHRIAKCADPREDHPVCCQDFFSLIRDLHGLSKRLKRFFNTFDIACIIINNNCHPLPPLTSCSFASHSSTAHSFDSQSFASHSFASNSNQNSTPLSKLFTP